MTLESESVDVELSIPELKELMRYDCYTFLAFYLEDELDMAIPDFHSEIWDELVQIINKVNLPTFIGHLQKLFCVPRGHAKSTLTKLAIILFMRYSKLSFTLYVSLTAGVAVQAIKDVYGWLTSDKDQLLWGEVTRLTANESKQIWELIIGVPGPNGEVLQKRIILRALGTDQQVRGTLIHNRRPELLIIDDCEDNDTAATPESQEKLDVWLMGNLLKATARYSVRIMLGNMINSRTMLYRFSKDQKWNPTVFGALIRDRETGELRALWGPKDGLPGLWTVESLLEDYADYRSKGTGHVWIYEMMNMTADSVFKTSMHGAVRGPTPNGDDIASGIITVDPAFGVNAWNDETAVTVHVKLKGQLMPWVAETDHGRWSEEFLLDRLIELSYKWNLATWGIESVAAQKLLIPLFKALLRERMIPPDIFTMIPLPSGGVAKASRILAFAKSVGEQSYGIVDDEDELVEILEKYDPASKEHDDRADSAAYGLIAWAQEGNQIKEAGAVKIALDTLFNGEYVEAIGQDRLVPY